MIETSRLPTSRARRREPMFTKILACPRLLLAAVFCLFLAPAVKADPLVITAGTATFTRSFLTHTTLNFSGQGFSVVARGDAFSIPNACPHPGPGCVPGGSVSLTYNPYLSFSDWITGGATVNGNYYLFSSSGPLPPAAPAIHFSFAGFFIAPPVGISPMTDAATISVTSPFTFNGNMGGRSAEGFMFGEQLTGSGYATMTLTRYSPTGDYIFSSVTYGFEPVPEPATIFLLASGVGMLAARLRSRLRRP